jgi:hypothetical protein
MPALIDLNRKNPMRKFLLVVATLPLFSCFPVEDFGAYWDKAGADKRLAGSWEMSKADLLRLGKGDAPPLAMGFGRTVRFVERGGAFEMSVEDGQTVYPVKTLSVGRYQFFATGPEKTRGRIQRYRVGGRMLEFCTYPDPSVVEEFVKTHYPNAVNMKKNTGDGDYMEIVLFDDEVFKILSNIPDTKAYWVCDVKYQRVP